MKIHVLLENKTSKPELGCEHGLSLLIETQGQRILFDTGASPLFSQNAEFMGIDLSNVDLAILSHGHYDHGGGMKAFFELNSKAPVIIQESAFDEYCSWEGTETRYIGVPREATESVRYRKVKGNHVLSENLEILSEVQPLRLNPPDNRVMYRKIGDQLVPDDFSHEQNLILREAGRTILITGCAHKGIVNILEAFHERYGYNPDVVIGGFHLRSKVWNKEIIDTVNSVADYMAATPTIYYTGHCTSEEAFRQLQERLGDQVQGLAAGLLLEFQPVE